MRPGIVFIPLLISACASTPHASSNKADPPVPLELKKQACIKDPNVCNKVPLSELTLNLESAVLVQNLCIFGKKPEACLEAGNRYLNKKNKQKADRFYNLGCGHKDETSCAQISQNHAKLAPEKESEDLLGQGFNPAKAIGIKKELKTLVYDPKDLKTAMRASEPAHDPRKFILFEESAKPQSGLNHRYFLDRTQFHPEPSDHCGDSFNILSESRDAIYYFGGEQLKSGEVKGEKPDFVLESGSSKTIRFLSQTLVIKHEHGTVVLSDGTREQTVLHQDGDTVTLRFVGDLDQDGKADLILSVDYHSIDTSHGGGVDDTSHATFLFLSSPAKSEEILSPESFYDYGDYASDDC